MNDLTCLRDAWGEPAPPSQTAHTAARAALMRRIAADCATEPAPRPLHPRGLRLPWLAGGTAVTAALAAAVALTLVPGTTQAPQPADQVAGTAGQLSGQQILLAAATVAEARPAGTGAYWHLKEYRPAPSATGSSTRMETLDNWTARDGTVYVPAQDGTGVWPITTAQGFQVGMARLSYEQLLRLPTDPAALKAWIIDSFNHPSGPNAGPASAPAKPAFANDRVAALLSYLLWEVPAPPAVRAAAFRALAAMPNVTSLGARDGGQALRISFPAPSADKYPDGKVPEGADQITLVIDPVTSTLLSTISSSGTDKILTAEWTNDIPKIVQAPHK